MNGRQRELFPQPDHHHRTDSEADLDAWILDYFRTYECADSDRWCSIDWILGRRRSVFGEADLLAIRRSLERLTARKALRHRWNYFRPGAASSEWSL